MIAFHHIFTYILTGIIFFSTIVTNANTNTIKFLSDSNLDRDTALMLAEASVQAYNVMDKNNPSICHLENVIPPTNYEVVDCWTGVDQVFNRYKQVESYGVVFRSEQAPYNYIFAFRGTYSVEDLVDDFGFNLTNFTPHNTNISIPNNYSR